MARKHATPSAVPPTVADPYASRPSASAAPKSKHSSSTSSTTTSASGSGSIRNAHDVQAIVAGIWHKYLAETPQRTRLVDVFLAFLMLVGAIQFVYCVVAGNFPFNAFLSGFGATIGQFVLTVSLRMQTSTDNKAEFQHISHERAFADYILGSAILHFACCNFIN